MLRGILNESPLVVHYNNYHFYLVSILFNANSETLLKKLNTLNCIKQWVSQAWLR